MRVLSKSATTDWEKGYPIHTNTDTNTDTNSFQAYWFGRGVALSVCSLLMRDGYRSKSWKLTTAEMEKSMNINSFAFKNRVVYLVNKAVLKIEHEGFGIEKAFVEIADELTKMRLQLDKARESVESMGNFHIKNADPQYRFRVKQSMDSKIDATKDLEYLLMCAHKDLFEALKKRISKLTPGLKEENAIDAMNRLLSEGEKIGKSLEVIEQVDLKSLSVTQQHSIKQDLSYVKKHSSPTPGVGIVFTLIILALRFSSLLLGDKKVKKFS